MQFVVSGDLLCQSNQYEQGYGVYLRNNNYYASISGYYSIENNKVEIKRKGNDFQSIKIGHTIIGKIQKIKDDHATVQILSIQNESLDQFYDAIIRKQNIRLAEIDKLKMEECFLPGDIIKAKILSYGDSKKIYLTTAENDLGVMFANSQKFNQMMIPYSWEQMICPLTKQLEKRKVAKPDFNYIK